jgi:hypothetical protein
LRQKVSCVELRAWFGPTGFPTYRMRMQELVEGYLNDETTFFPCLISVSSMEPGNVFESCERAYPSLSFSIVKPILSQLNLRPIVRQSNTHQRPGLDTTVSSRVGKTTKDKLVDREVQVTILANSKLRDISQQSHHQSQKRTQSKLTVSTQFNLGSLTNVFTVPLAGLKIDTAFCSMLPW